LSDNIRFAETIHYKAKILGCKLKKKKKKERKKD
jgi:hypothetical protein